MIYSIKGKKLHVKKYHRTCSSTMTKSPEFILFTVVFLHHFALSLSLSLSFSLSFFFPSPPPFESFFVLYTMVFTPVLPSTWVRRWESFFSVLPCLSLNLPLLVVRLLLHCSGITSTLMRPEN